MSTIPDNAIVTVVVADAQTVAGFSGGLNGSDVLSAVSSYLNGLGNYQVEATSSSGDVGAMISPLIQETFQATIKLQVFSSEDTSQLATDIQAAFAEVAGETPTQITIPSFTAPGAAQETSTGQVAPTPTASQAASNAANTATKSVSDAVSSFFSQLTSTAKSLLIGLAAVIIIVLVLIAYGPNVGAIASHA